MISITPPSITNPRFDWLTGEVARAQHAVNQGDYPEAGAIYRRCLAAAEQLGANAPDVLWGLAIVEDNQGNFKDAIRYCGRALAADPLSPTYRNSWRVIGGRVAAALLDPDRPDVDGEIPALHALASEAGLGNEAVHVRLARHFVATDQLDRADRILESVTQLYRDSVNAWLLRSNVAKRMHNDAVANRCATELRRLKQGPAAFQQLGLALS